MGWAKGNNSKLKIKIMWFCFLLLLKHFWKFYHSINTYLLLFILVGSLQYNKRQAKSIFDSSVIKFSNYLFDISIHVIRTWNYLILDVKVLKVLGIVYFFSKEHLIFVVVYANKTLPLPLKFWSSASNTFRTFHIHELISEYFK